MNKHKRFLLMLAIGVSFTPAVLAAADVDRAPASRTDQQNFMKNKVVEAHTGEEKLSETGTGSWMCEYKQMIKKLDAEISAHQDDFSQGSAASAKGARRR